MPTINVYTQEFHYNASYRMSYMVQYSLMYKWQNNLYLQKLQLKQLQKQLHIHSSMHALHNGCKIYIFSLLFPSKYGIVAGSNHFFNYTYHVVTFVTTVVPYATVGTYDYSDMQDSPTFSHIIQLIWTLVIFVVVTIRLEWTTFLLMNVLPLFYQGIFTIKVLKRIV